MKRKITILFAMQCIVLCLTANIFAQSTVTIPASNPAGTGSTASPYRKPLGSNRAFERSAMLYKHNEIGQLGTITSVAFFVDSLNLPGDAIARIFIKEVTDTIMAVSTVNAAETGATLVYDDTIFAAQFVSDNWITIPLTTSFTHATTNSIVVIVETNSGTLIGTDVNTISKGFRYFATLGNTFQYWQSPTNNATAPAGNGTANLNRPNIQFQLTALPACTTPPNAGVVAVSNDSVCVGNVINLSLSGADIGSGITYQWLSSNDGANWSVLNNDTNATFNPIINADSLFSCVLTCSGVADTTAPVSIYLKPFYNCYCVPTVVGNCTSAIDSVSITGTTLQNGASGCVTPYNAFPYSANTTATITQGQVYELATKYNGNARASLWIDYNHNGNFDNNEWSQICLTSTAGVNVLSNFTVPYSALTGVTGMRIRSRAFNGVNDTTTTCSNLNSGEIEDYLIDITLASACVAPPDAGITIASQDSVCAGNNINLSLNSNASGAGISYQWISSNDAVNWVAVPGQNQISYNPTIVADSVFACVVTCSAQSDTSTFVNITLNAFINCYCNANLGGNCATTALDSIAIELTTLANGLTGCAPAFYASFPATGTTTADVTQGQTYNLITRYNGAARSACWIDFNHNGTFDNNEWTNITNTSVAGVDVVSLLSIPLTANLGQTRMRVRTRATNGALDSTLACATFGSGETEDYFINIVAAPNCIAPPNAGNALASQDSICAGSNVIYSLDGITIGLGQTYQWIASNDGTNWIELAGENGTTLSAIINTDSLFACIVTCSGLSDTSTIASVVINPFYNCYCTLNVGGNCAASAIDSVAITSTTLQNGPTGCAPTFYTAYPNSGNNTADLTLGQTYELVARFNANVRTSMWIDYDHNGVFDTYEWVQVCDTSVADTNVYVNFTVPSSALTGLTGMRVRSRVTAGANDSTSACATFGTGEIEDYLVTIQQIVGLQNNAPTQGITVFPNPSNGHITITSQNKIKQINVFDVCGKEMNLNVNPLNTNKSDVFIPQKGIYFIHVTNLDGTIKNHKVIVN